MTLPSTVRFHTESLIQSVFVSSVHRCFPVCFLQVSNVSGPTPSVIAIHNRPLCIQVECGGTGSYRQDKTAGQSDKKVPLVCCLSGEFFSHSVAPPNDFAISLNNSCRCRSHFFQLSTGLSCVLGKQLRLNNSRRCRHTTPPAVGRLWRSSVPGCHGGCRTDVNSFVRVAKFSSLTSASPFSLELIIFSSF